MLPVLAGKVRESSLSAASQAVPSGRRAVSGEGQAQPVGSAQGHVERETPAPEKGKGEEPVLPAPAGELPAHGKVAVHVEDGGQLPRLRGDPQVKGAVGRADAQLQRSPGQSPCQIRPLWRSETV